MQYGKIFYENFVERLLSEPFFTGYRFRNSQFLDQEVGEGKERGRNSLNLRCIKKWDEVYFTPSYRKRFNILHKWYENFLDRPLHDQRNDASIYYATPREDDIREKSLFWYDKTNVMPDARYQKFKDYLVYNMDSLIVKRIPTLDSLYEYEVAPIINGVKNFQFEGVEDMLLYTALTKIVDYDRYEKMKKISMDWADYLVNGRKYPEPNVAKYYPNKLKEIFEYLDSIDFNTNYKKLI